MTQVGSRRLFYSHSYSKVQLYVLYMQYHMSDDRNNKEVLHKRKYAFSIFTKCCARSQLLLIPIMEVTRTVATVTMVVKKTHA